MKIIENLTFDEERALYGVQSVKVAKCRFDGPSDGESAFKECSDVLVCDCYFNLRYPFWHDSGVKIHSSQMTEQCRAALWYSDDVEISNTEIHGIKALRECCDVDIKNSSIKSAEFGWMSEGIKISDSHAEGEYFMFRAANINLVGLDFRGKYSFQYIENAVIENCNLDTKDAFWHAKNVTVRNSTVKGEYLGWYCENVTFENCKIIGTQPLCYCKGLRLIGCEMIDCDLAFERSDVEADVKGYVVSIKNPKSGIIRVGAVGEIISEYPDFDCNIEVKE
jgi:polygalacturonase